MLFGEYDVVGGDDVKNGYDDILGADYVDDDYDGYEDIEVIGYTLLKFLPMMKNN